MPRTARIVAPGVAYHVTQRSAGRQIVFYTRRDRQVYLGLLIHVHLVGVPNEEEASAMPRQRPETKTLLFP